MRGAGWEGAGAPGEKGEGVKKHKWAVTNWWWGCKVQRGEADNTITMSGARRGLG